MVQELLVAVRAGDPPAPMPPPAHGPSDSLVRGGLGGAALWVLTWLVVQLHGALGWAPPLLPGGR